MKSGIRLWPLEKSQKIDKRRGKFIQESRVLHLISAEEEFLKVPCFHKMNILRFNYEQTLEHFF